MERISPPEVKSKHVVICITGFLQEDQSKFEYWEHLIGYYKHSEIFAVSWNACTVSSFFSTGGTFQKNVDEKKKASGNVFSHLINFMNTGKRQFLYAVDQARVTGTLLAMFLAKSSFAENRSISVIGYSLGGVASFYLMRVLKRLNDIYDSRCGRIINDVQLWAAAYVIDLSK